MTDNQFSLAVINTTVAYALFAIPSNYLLKYMSPQRWLPFIMFGWGATEMIIAISQNYNTLLGLRFLLGVFQAGECGTFLVRSTSWTWTDPRSHPRYDIHFHNVRSMFLPSTQLLFNSSAAGIGFENGVYVYR